MLVTHICCPSSMVFKTFYTKTKPTKLRLCRLRAGSSGWVFISACPYNMVRPSTEWCDRAPSPNLRFFDWNSELMFAAQLCLHWRWTISSQTIVVWIPHPHTRRAILSQVSHSYHATSSFLFVLSPNDKLSANASIVCRGVSRRVGSRAGDRETARSGAESCLGCKWALPRDRLSTSRNADFVTNQIYYTWI